MIDFFISDSFKGYLTNSDVLMNAGSLCFKINKNEIQNGGFLFSIAYEKFIFNI